MKYLIIDTETSGLFDFSKRADEEGQPRLAHLAMIRASEDLSETETVDVLVKPDGWTMSDEVAKIHGLTTEYLTEHGVPISEAIDAYAKAIDEGLIVVTFNAQYDTKIMRGEMRRAEVDDRFEKTPNICVMRALVDVCKIPKKTGKGFKFPKLSEAMAHFDLANEKEHSATGDAKACLDLMRELVKLNKLPDAAVHYAKVDPNKPVEVI